MSLVETAVRRPVGTVVLAVCVLVVGIVASQRLPVDLLPEVDFPRVSVVTQYEGVGPEQMETLVTRPIEQAVAAIEGIESIESVSAEGMSRIQLQFAWGTALDPAVADLRAALDQLGNVLPDDARRPVVIKQDLSSVPIVTIGIAAEGDPRQIRYLADETLTRRFERVPGAANVTVQGGRVREIQVNLDASRLVALQVTATEVADALRRDNRDVSAGDMRADGQVVLVRSVGEWRRPSELLDLLVTHRDGRPIYVRDLARVDDTFRKMTSEKWVDGVRGVVVTVSKQADANTVEVVDGVRAEIERINREYAGRLQLRVLRDSSDFIRRSVAGVQSSALFGAALAFLVLLVFLRNVRATLVIGIAIPLSALAALAVMYLTHFTLNVISFGGLALGIGMLVDNSIVILENIQRRRDAGEPHLQAAVDGAREMVPSIVAGTVTTVVVFAPVVFLGGFAGVFFTEMAAVVTFSLLASLLVAVTLVPSLSAVRIAGTWDTRGPLHVIGDGIGWALRALDRAYMRLVASALRAPWFVLALSLLVLVASATLVPRVGFELMPETDEGLLEVDVELPSGTPLEQTTEVVVGLEKSIRGLLRDGELRTVLTSAGPDNWWKPEGTNVGELEVYLAPVSQRARGMNELLRAVRAGLVDTPDAKLRVRQGNSNFLMRIIRGGHDERLGVDIRGHDQETARTLAREVETALRSVPGVTHAYREEPEGIDEQAVRVAPARAAELGLTRADVAETLATYVLGEIVTRYRELGREFDVRVELRPEDRVDTGQLARLPVPLPGGGSVPLAGVADVRVRSVPSAIVREGQERVVRVLAAVGDRALGNVVRDLEAALAPIQAPDGFRLAIAGELIEQQRTFEGLQVGILLALFLVFVVMAVQFESIRHPLVIMVSVPFAFIGAIAMLVLTGTTFNMYSFLGSIVLVGIVVNNAIILVDSTNRARREGGAALVPALVATAGRRLRPILMTTLTTVLAMIPLAMGGGEGGEAQAPLARVVVGGLTSSTLVTLVLVPCVYLLVERDRSGSDPIT